MTHVVLLGDSIFDNAAYVRRGEPDVVAQLRAKLPRDWKATLCAVDGAVTSGVLRQLGRVPSDASHLVVSVGGNDALQNMGVLREGARSVAEAMGKLAGVRERWPGVAVVMMSGHSDESSGPIPDGGDFVSKPYLFSHLVPALERLIGRA